MAGGGGDVVEQRLEPRRVRLGEVVQNVGRDRVLRPRVADADAHARVLVAEVGGERAQAVVAGVAAAGLHLDLARREVELVVKDDDVADVELQEADGIARRAADSFMYVCGFRRRTRWPAISPSAVSPRNRLRQGEKRCCAAIRSTAMNPTLWR